MAPVCVGALSAHASSLRLCCAHCTCRGTPLSLGWIRSFTAQGRVSFLGDVPRCLQCSQCPGRALRARARVLVFDECVQGSGSGQLGHTLDFICAKPLSDRSAGAERIAHEDLFLKLFTKT